MKGKSKNRKATKLQREDNSRKTIRKQKRLVKKANRRQHYTKVNSFAKKEAKQQQNAGRFVKRPPNSEECDEVELPKKKKFNQSVKSAQDVFKEERDREIKKEKMLQKEMEEQRRKMLLEANEDEDKLIKKLEKQLGMSKIKNKKNLFANDGLDYLLEVCDKSTQEQLTAAQKHLANVDAESDFEDDLAAVTGKEPARKKKLEDSEGSDESEGSLDEGDEEDLENEELSETDSESEDESKENTHHNKEENKFKETNKKAKKAIQNIARSDSENDDSAEEVVGDEESDDYESVDDHLGDVLEPDEQKEKPDEWEDIYGRKRDKDGNVIKEEKGAYIPPHLRNNDTSSQSEEMIRLKRQMKGVLNKLAVTNLHWACTTIESLYNSSSRNAVNTALTDLWTDAVIQSAITPDRMLAEHAALVSVLQANVGTEVGAHFLQVLVKKFDAMTTEQRPSEGKHLENLTVALAYLYNFKIYEASLVYELMSRLLSVTEGAEGERRVACVLSALRAAGGTLRRDKPLALKTFIQETQAALGKASSEAASGSRIKYLLDVLMAVKNNNLTKLHNYDPQNIEDAKKMTKSIIRRGNYVTTLNISLEDLLKADVRGKWWVVGSAWEGGDARQRQSNTQEREEKNMVPTADAKLLELARKQRMNTDIRRNIFCIIMSAQDYMDAFEKLQHLGLKNQQEREMVHVLLACCLQEKTYNPYYTVLANKLCDFDRKLQLSIQYAVWDKIKDLENSSSLQMSNLAQFLIHLIMEKGLPLSVLKVIEFSDLNKKTVRFMRQILLAIIMNENLQSCLEVFQRIAAAPKLHMFRESLRLFIQHFLIRNAGKKKSILSEEEMATLKDRAQQVEKILSMHDSKLRL